MSPHPSPFSFTRFAKVTSRATGRPIAFMLAVGVVLAWLITGPVFHYSDTWQLVINTATTVVTFLMVFLIQNTQYRDIESVHIKLDELLRTTEGAHVALLDLEELSDKELDRLKACYEELAAQARARIRRGDDDTGIFDVETPVERET